MVVVIFPALDTISVFPLIANTLGNNLFSASGGKSIKMVARRSIEIRSMLARNAPIQKYESLPLSEKTEVLEEATRISSLAWRAVAAFPPLLFSLVATDLSFSFKLAGLAGIYVAFVAPALLQLESFRHYADPTIFCGWYSRRFLCFPVLGFAAFSLGVVLLQIRNAFET